MRIIDPIDDSGPAFPSHGTMGEVVQEGMSLRDYFAAAVLQGLYAHDNSRLPVDVGAYCYKQADAMLKARKA